MKHTHGPWYAVQYANYWNVQNEDGYCDSNILDEEKCPDAEANAKLIAAAPELLKALLLLKQWVGKLSDWEGEDPPCEIVDVALQKAIGRTSE